MINESTISAIREELEKADTLLIGAGAGMGVDSGLPDFRGNEGFWKAYPPYQKLGLNFISVANPDNFHNDPTFGWGFYGHRFNLYKETKPHDGFRILKEFGDSLQGGCFVYTSNVDGHFEIAGFPSDRVVECHGSVNHFQCINNCLGKVYYAEWDQVEIDESTMRAVEPLPSCPDCGALARPAILMFGDWEWNYDRTALQEERFGKWLSGVRGKRIVVMEFGAGTAIKSVRYQCERVAITYDASLVRINPRESHIPTGINGISVSAGALETLRAVFEK